MNKTLKRVRREQSETDDTLPFGRTTLKEKLYASH